MFAVGAPFVIRGVWLSWVDVHRGAAEGDRCGAGHAPTHTIHAPHTFAPLAHEFTFTHSYMHHTCMPAPACTHHATLHLHMQSSIHVHMPHHARVRSCPLTLLFLLLPPPSPSLVSMLALLLLGRFSWSTAAAAAAAAAAIVSCYWSTAAALALNSSWVCRCRSVVWVDDG